MNAPVEWEKRDKTNCHRKGGAVPINPNPWKVGSKATFSLSECQKECAKKPSCEGIVVQRGKEHSGKCFLRTSLQPEKCRRDPRYVVYIIRRGGKRGNEAEEKTKGDLDNIKSMFILDFMNFYSRTCPPFAGPGTLV